MPAHHDRDELAQRAVGDLLLGVGDLGIEALRIADGEFEVAALGERDQFVGLPQLHGDRFFKEHVLAGLEAVARNRKMGVLRRGADIDDADRVIVDDILIVERGACRIGQRLDLGEPVGPDFADVQLLHQRRARQRLGADAAAPAGADDRDFELVHGRFLPSRGGIKIMTARDAQRLKVVEVRSSPAPR